MEWEGYRKLQVVKFEIVAQYFLGRTDKETAGSPQYEATHSTLAGVNLL
jgi:hypothetical protein